MKGYQQYERNITRMIKKLSKEEQKKSFYFDKDDKRYICIQGYFVAVVSINVYIGNLQLASDVSIDTVLKALNYSCAEEVFVLPLVVDYSLNLGYKARVLESEREKNLIYLNEDYISLFAPLDDFTCRISNSKTGPVTIFYEHDPVGFIMPLNRDALFSRLDYPISIETYVRRVLG
jgi:hypothetical protein